MNEKQINCLYNSVIYSCIPFYYTRFYYNLLNFNKMGTIKCTKTIFVVTVCRWKCWANKIYGTCDTHSSNIHILSGQIFLCLVAKIMSPKTNHKLQNLVNSLKIKESKKFNTKLCKLIKHWNTIVGLWCLTPLSTIFQLKYHQKSTFFQKLRNI